MKTREIRLIVMAGIIFIPFALMSLVPMVNNYFAGKENEIQRLEERYERYRDLLNNAKMWNELEEQRVAEVKDYETWVFSGSTPNLIGTSIQRELRNIVDSAGLTLRDMSVARFRQVEGWYIVDQEMSFIIDQNEILPFIDLLEESAPHLFVTDFSINRNRRQFTGSITVTGFGRTNNR